MRELTLNEVGIVSGADGASYEAAGSGGTLGGLLATGTIEGAAAGGVLGVAVATAFNFGYAVGTVANDYFGISDWIVDELTE